METLPLRGFGSLFHEHGVAVVIVGGVCVWISLCLIVRMWLTYRGESVLKLVLWSLELAVPFLGWIMYAGFFRTPERLFSPNSVEAAVQDMP